jgi:hypothetical protein
MRMTVYSGWLMVVLGVALGVGGAVGLSVAYGALMFVSLAGSGAFMVWLGAGWDKPLENSAELYRYGRPANATVLEVADEDLRPDGTRTAKLKLHVMPVNERAYNTTRVLALPKARVPLVGESLTVKFDPQSRKNLVLLEEKFEVEDSVAAARRNMRAMSDMFSG